MRQNTGKDAARLLHRRITNCGIDMGSDAYAAVLMPLCIACVTAESAARLFIDDGFVLVSASCVFSEAVRAAPPFVT